MSSPVQTRTARVDAVERRAADLFGPVDWARATGVVHVAAIESARRTVIAIGPEAPRSDADRFVLGLARARADAIVTSGAVLRAEPDLVHRYAEDPAHDEALAAWRAQCLGRGRRPALIVLTRTGELPAEHPALARAEAGLVWTTPAGRRRLGPRLAALEVVSGASEEEGAAGKRGGGIAAALRFARGCGMETLVVEAGPRASRSLYAGEGRGPEGSAFGSGSLDELLLSEFTGRLAPAAVGPRFVSRDSVERSFPDPPVERVVDEPSGAWRLLRYRRASVDSPDGDRDPGDVRGRRTIGHSVGPSGMRTSRTTSKPKRS